MMRRIKGSTSKWVNESSRSTQHFSWQRGYGAFSVSESAVENVISYIGNQDEHHKKITFEEEFLLLLQKHKISYDEKYIWD
jgi:putative transposase